MNTFTILPTSPLEELIAFAQDSAPPSVIKWLENLPPDPGTFDVPKDIQISLRDVLFDFYATY